jgi:hypothetical protein
MTRDELAVAGMCALGAISFLAAVEVGPSLVDPDPTGSVAVVYGPARPPCASGVTVIVNYWESTPCTLDGTQVLVELGLTPDECDAAGGRYAAKRCVDRDY